MAINLKSLSKPTGQRPVIMTLFGEGGMGKTTLAAMMPGPVVFIRTEDGTASLTGNDNVSLFPLATSSQEVLDAIETLGTEKHEFKTLIIDSITQLATIIESEIVAADPKAKSINQAAGGFGAGYGAASEIHRQVREYAGSLAYESGMNVVFLAHADVETLTLPDMDPYNRYVLKLHKKSQGHWTDNVDLVGLIRLKTFTRGEGDKKRAISTGEREILCFPQASSVTKNRFNITEPLPFTFEGGNPFTEFLPNQKEK
jgi:phage nucleotide-binding protein